jgi:hypothetical protein
MHLPVKAKFSSAEVHAGQHLKGHVLAPSDSFTAWQTTPMIPVIFRLRTCRRWSERKLYFTHRLRLSSAAALLCPGFLHRTRTTNSELPIRHPFAQKTAVSMTDFDRIKPDTVAKPSNSARLDFPVFFVATQVDSVVKRREARLGAVGVAPDGRKGVSGVMQAIKPIPRPSALPATGRSILRNQFPIVPLG